MLSDSTLLGFTTVGGTAMSIFKKVRDVLAGESGHLKKIRAEAERRRAEKSGSMPKTEGDVIDKTVESLQARIDSGQYKK